MVHRPELCSFDVAVSGEAIANQLAKKSGAEILSFLADLATCMVGAGEAATPSTVDQAFKGFLGQALFDFTSEHRKR